MLTLLLLQADENYTWLVLFYYIFLFGGSLFFLFRVFESWYANTYNKPLYRHFFVYKKLTSAQFSILEKEFEFYKQLSKKHKKQFEHRVAAFISDKKFVGRKGLLVTDTMKVLIASIGCMLSFGRKNYLYGLVNHILIYPEEFYSTANNAYHKGEFNPAGKALVLSWEAFEKGYRITDDNLNLGIHEFMHAMQLEAKQSKDVDSARLLKQFKNILVQLSQPEIKEKISKTQFFRSYAFTNQYEFLAVLTECFFESPEDLKKQFPKIYESTQKLLNFNFANY